MSITLAGRSARTKIATATLAAALMVAATPLAVRRGTSPPAAPSCASCSLAAGTANASTTQICDLQVVAVEAGQSFAVRGSRPLPGGRPDFPNWSANAGSIDASGTYTAPATPPPGGVDVIQYLDTTTGTDASVMVVVLPAVVPPLASAPTPTFTVGDANAGPPSTPRATPNGGPKAPTGTNSAYEAATQGAKLSGATPLALSGMEEAPVTRIGGVTGVALTGVVSSDPNLRLVASEPSRALAWGRRCGVLPRPDWLNVKCRGGSTFVEGPLVRRSDTGTERLGSLKVTPQMSLDLKVFNISVSVGATFDPVSQRVEKVREWYNTDYYVCRNGAWVYDRSTQCSRTYWIYREQNPTWAHLIGYGGKPGTSSPNPAPFNCTGL